MVWYVFNQNNSGGVFDRQPKYGIHEYVFIEAQSPKVANARAEELGIYFDGCFDGRDCSCCGDRWYKVDEHESDIKRTAYEFGVDFLSNKLDRTYFHPYEGDFFQPTSIEQIERAGVVLIRNED